MAAAEEMSPRRRNRRQRPARDNFRWSKAEDARLTWGYGHVDIYRLAAQLERTPEACQCRAYELGLPGVQQGRLSVAAVARRIGHSSRTILRVAEHLGLNVRAYPHMSSHRRVAKVRRRYLDDDQVEAIIAALSGVGWPLRPSTVLDVHWSPIGRIDQCLRCGTSKRQHRSRGLCCTCYEAVRRSGGLERYRPVRKATVCANA